MLGDAINQVMENAGYCHLETCSAPGAAAPGPRSKSDGTAVPSRIEGRHPDHGDIAEPDAHASKQAAADRKCSDSLE